MKITIFFPWPKYTAEMAWQWTKDRNTFDNCPYTRYANPDHWDRENILKEPNTDLNEKWFAWRGDTNFSFFS